MRLTWMAWLFFFALAPLGAADGASMWLFGVAAVIALLFAVLALFLAVSAEDLRTQLIQVAAGTGSIAGIVALLARSGLIAAVKVGLGGRFGGGGAGRGG